MDDLKKLAKNELMLSFEESINAVRNQAARLGTTMGTSSQATDLADLNLLTERYALIKTEMLRRML